MALDEHTIQQFIATAGQHHFTSDLPSHLECSICQNLLEDPVVCDNGSHTFCKKCLIDWMGRSERPLCPIDREDLKVTPQGPRRAPRALQDCIDALELVCALGESPVTPFISIDSSWTQHLSYIVSPYLQDVDGKAEKENGQIIYVENAQKWKMIIIPIDEPEQVAFH